jgi:hypothetical protein
MGLIFTALLESLVHRLFSEEKRQLNVPITIVDHKEDGSWQFFSGTYLIKIRITDIEEAIENDITVRELKDLPLGYSAMRENTDFMWMRYKTSEGNATNLLRQRINH